MLLDPRTVVDGRDVWFLRDAFGGEAPLSCPYPPLELAFTAAVLRQHQVPVELIPANVLGLSHRAVAARLRLDPPSLLLFPTAWGSLEDDRLLLSILRAVLPDTTLVVSGPNVTAMPELLLGDKGAHFVILGEPEEAVLLLAQGRAPSLIPNLASRQDGQTVSTPRRIPLGFESYPLPARDLLPLDRYVIPFARRSPCTTLVTTRGCPGTCTFCPSQLWHDRDVRGRPVDLVMQEIDELVGRYRMRDLVFRDDTFTWSRDRTLALCDALLRRGHDLSWRCFATVSTVDPDLLKTMAQAGCTQVCYGFESGVDRLLATTGKRTTVAQGRDAARWTHQAGIEVAGTFLLGLEGETRQSIEETLAFAVGADLDYLQVNVATALPGTPFGRRHERTGQHSHPERFRWFGTPSGASVELNGQDLAREVRRFYRRYYLRPGYVLGRLRSGRGLVPLVGHARLGLRLARATVRGGR
ncbi:MAG: radical SAM protein [Oligoflexia bacterium]|nr:radical SAM protein [Oligoflexia bacterium]